MMNPIAILVAILTFIAVLGLVAPVEAIDEQAFYTALRDHTLNTNMSSNLLQAPVALSPDSTKLGLEAEFSISDANIFARLSAASYCAPYSIKDGKSGLQNWKCRACVDSGITMTESTPFRIPAADLFGFVGYNPASDSISVVFTGSQSLVNWIYNLDAKFIKFPGVPGATVHSGFFTAWTHARPTIISMINEVLYRHPTARVTFSGHSLGGAVATLATWDLATSVNGYQIHDFGARENGWDPIVIGNNLFDPISLPHGTLGASDAKFVGKYRLGGPTYTFGAPRVGNDELAQYFTKILGKAQIYRITHNQDPVPHLPPLALWNTAQHPTTEVYYANGATSMSDFTICPEPETKHCSNQWLLPIKMADHLNYMSYPVGAQLISYC